MVRLVVVVLVVVDVLHRLPSPPSRILCTFTARPGCRHPLPSHITATTTATLIPPPLLLLLALLLQRYCYCCSCRYCNRRAISAVATSTTTRVSSSTPSRFLSLPFSVLYVLLRLNFPPGSRDAFLEASTLGWEGREGVAESRWILAYGDGWLGAGFRSSV